MRFKEGQQVVCIAGQWLPHKPTGRILRGPKHHEIVTVHSYKNERYVRIKEYLYDCETGALLSFEEKFFEPLMDISELIAIAKTEPAEI